MEHEPMMTIGEAAKVVGVSPKAIRVWESRGLIPEAQRTPVGYRAFTDADVSTMRFIRQAKALGLTLAEIGDVLELRQAGTSPCDVVVQAIDKHLAAIDQAMADLVQVRRTLTAARRAADAPEVNLYGATVCSIIEGGLPAGAERGNADLTLRCSCLVLSSPQGPTKRDQAGGQALPLHIGASSRWATVDP